ncbi:beta-hexosaminidase subunit alpha-like [Euwallacea similis]|uniref:beta-hexosaminidase subunit alpha-like n=1 Tax=Euwallacea similis TaxID=1736056 RepID=UPI00344DBCDF
MKSLTALVLIVACADAYVVNPGPKYPATKGYVWPAPQQQLSIETYYSVNVQKFAFKASETCNILYNAQHRYLEIIQTQVPALGRIKVSNDNNYLGELAQVTINLTDICDDNAYPNIDMDESYILNVAEDGASISAQTVWGALRAMETFSQLLYLAEDGISTRINTTSIVDSPRFPHRGILVDTSRHFIPLEQLKQIIDAMTFNKLNVFHWHIVDDQSFPFVSMTFPELSAQGAYHPQLYVYSPDDVAEIIEYSRQRGIRVIPEFDSPGHTRSWGISHPELLTPCNSIQQGSYGPMDPTKNLTYTFVEDLFAEVRKMFRDQFIHLGGDEVDFDCWESDDNITAFMTEKNITSYANLEGYYIQKILDAVDKLNFSSIVWEEVFSNGVNLPNETIVHVWRDWSGNSWVETMYQVTKMGKTGLLSACWYLDHLTTGGDWQTFYECEPTEFGGTPEQTKLLLGGEACMWSEVVNQYNIVQRIFPRASAAAEKLWSAKVENIDTNFVSRRLEEHVCRMNKRGIPAQPPNAAGFCL